MMEMAVESMEMASRGHFPVPAGCQNRDLSPEVELTMTAAAEVFVEFHRSG